MVRNQTLNWGSLSRTPGIPEMLLMLVQKTMVGRLTYNSEIQVPIHTTIPSVLTSHPIKELRVNCKGSLHSSQRNKLHKGSKTRHRILSMQWQEPSCMWVGPDDDVEEIKKLVIDDMRNIMSMTDKSGEGGLCTSIYSWIIGHIIGVLKDSSSKHNY